MDYPRTYRVSRFWRGSFLVCAAVLMVLTFFVGRAAVTSEAWLAVLAALFGGLGAYCLLLALRSRVTLHPDRLEITEAWRTRVFDRGQFSGWRVNSATTPSILVLERSKTGRRPLNVGNIYRFDEAFFDWLGDVPNLDDRETMQSLEEVESDPDLGLTPDTRLDALARAARLARWLNGAAVAVFLWAFIYPSPYEAVVGVCALAPWIGIILAARSRGLFRIDQQRNQARPHLPSLFILPSFALLLLAVLDLDLLWPAAAIWPTVVIGLGLFVAARRADPTLRRKRSTALAVLAFALVYGFGAGVHANVLLDRAPQATYTAAVLSKRIRTGKYTDYVLHLGPWGPQRGDGDITVVRSLYEGIQPGDSVCVHLRPGALRIPWYTVERCR
jgi:hypothetical protein